MHKLKKKKEIINVSSLYPNILKISLCVEVNRFIRFFFFFFLSFEMLQIKQPTEGRLRQSHAERSLSPSQHMT